MIDFKIERSIVMAQRDSAIVEPNEAVGEALVVAVIQAIAIEVEVTAGGVTLHLAAWSDPDHWSEDWRAKGIDDPHEFIAGLNSQTAGKA